MKSMKSFVPGLSSRTTTNTKIECDRLLVKYPDRVPCIVLYDPKIYYIENKKYLVPINITFGQFVYIIRKNIKIQETSSIFVFTNNILIPSSMLIWEVYNKYKDPSGILFCTASLENAFG